MNVNMDVTGWFGDFQREVDALLSDMFQLSSAAEDKRYSSDTVNNTGLMGIIIANAEAFGETAPQRAARNAFIGAMSKFSALIDSLPRSGSSRASSPPREISMARLKSLRT